MSEINIEGVWVFVSCLWDGDNLPDNSDHAGESLGHLLYHTCQATQVTMIQHEQHLDSYHQDHNHEDAMDRGYDLGHRHPLGIISSLWLEQICIRGIVLRY